MSSTTTTLRKGLGIGFVGGCLTLVGVGSTVGGAAPPPPSPDPTVPADAVTTTVAPATAPPPLVHPTDVATPDCVIQIQPGDSLTKLAARFPDTAVTIQDLQAENGITDVNRIEAGAYLDICVGNQIDDIRGADRSAAPADDVDPATLDAVQRQQHQLNRLFAGVGLPELTLDGDAGPLTRRQLCAARVAFGLPASREAMVPGSPEEQTLMAATALPIPPAAPTGSDRWALVDKTCQIFFAGEGSSRLVFVFATSTGSEGYETRDQDRSRTFRFDPAIDNGGWHDSSVYPAASDNPLNGNMYKPLYFDNGQAIHGSYNVPPAPRSKGCVRLLVDNQDQLLAWLGLGDVTTQVWGADRLDLTVHVQGQY